jgi:uncharacterized protein YdiU (UPF0061 family)
MLRECVMGEAMHALGIPTTRALAVVATGGQVVRDTVLPGAVLVRVAASHLRVGTFEYAAANGGPELVRRLADHAIERHHPWAAAAAQPYLALLEGVVAAQASLVARWMQVGFIHGVMNTDNVTISGETIDYGPCAFMDAYDPATVFSSIDHGGRYAYGNQPTITLWNLARFAEALLALLDPDTDAAVVAATEVLESLRARAAPLGLAEYAQLWRLARRTGRPEPLLALRIVDVRRSAQGAIEPTVLGLANRARELAATLGTTERALVLGLAGVLVAAAAIAAVASALTPPPLDPLDF